MSDSRTGTPMCSRSGGGRTAAAAVLTRRVRPALDRALHRVALGALEEELHLLPPAQTADGTGVARHCLRPSAACRRTIERGSRCARRSYPSPLRRTAAVVGD